MKSNSQIHVLENIDIHSKLIFVVKANFLSLINLYTMGNSKLQ